MDKPFLTFHQQIKKLRDEYKLIIDDEEFAKEALSSLSYYDLVNGYQCIYVENDKFIKGTTIELLYSTHMFDKNIQGVLLKYATFVENSFKTLFSNIVAQHFTEDDTKYLQIDNYKRARNPDERKRLKKLLEEILVICKHCDDTPTKHYRETKNHIPPWILFRNVSFSKTTNLFSFLNTNEKEAFFSHFSIFDNDFLDYQNKVDISLNSLNLVRKFRNTIAHNLNFITYRKSFLNKNANLLFKGTLISESEIKKTRNDVWAMVISIVILLNNKYLVQNFLSEFQSFMILDKDLAKTYCNVTGIPLDFEYRINKYLTQLNAELENHVDENIEQVVEIT